MFFNKELLKEYQQRAKSYITQPATTDTKGGKAVVDVSVDVDGDDLVFVSRTSNAQADSCHNNNTNTFHRVKNFRDLVY